MHNPQHTFNKGERLRKKQHIDALFHAKKAFICFPFRVLYCDLEIVPKTSPAQILISIPKRKMKLAVHRNLLKRRTREAYRLQKKELYDFLVAKENTLGLGIVYIADEIVPYSAIYEAIGKIFLKLKKQL